MKIFFAVIISALALTAFTCGLHAATANGSFNYDFATDVPCSATVTSDCIDHFEIWDVTSTPKKLSTVPLPAPPSSSVNFSFKIGPPYGDRKWSAVAVAKDGTTSDMQKPNSQATIQVRPGSPASFVVNLN